MKKTKSKFPWGTIVFLLALVLLVPLLVRKVSNTGGDAPAETGRALIALPTQMIKSTQTVAVAFTSTPNNLPTIAALQTETRRQQVELEQNNIVMLQLQADQDARDFGRAQMTQAVESTVVAGTQAAAAYTAAAYPTSVPLTGTAESNHATATAAFYTATAHAPTLAAADLRLENDKRFAPLDHLMKMMMVIAICFFAVAFPVLLFMNWRMSWRKETTTQPEPHEEKPAPVVLEVRRNVGSAFPSADWFELPCTGDMLSEFSEGILSGAKGTGFNDWEGRGTLWCRKSYRTFRQWMVDHQLAMWGTGGSLVFEPDGELVQILRMWREKNELPPAFKFTDKPVENDNFVAPGNLELGKGTA